MGRALSAAVVGASRNRRRVASGSGVALRLRRDGGVHRHSARRLHLRVEEGSTAMGLSRRPDSAAARVVTGGEPWIATRLDFLVNWARANSLWPMPFGTACCAIEVMAIVASRYGVARFGMERPGLGARPSDVAIRGG